MLLLIQAGGLGRRVAGLLDPRLVDVVGEQAPGVRVEHGDARRFRGAEHALVVEAAGKVEEDEARVRQAGLELEVLAGDQLVVEAQRVQGQAVVEGA